MNSCVTVGQRQSGCDCSQEIIRQSESRRGGGGGDNSAHHNTKSYPVLPIVLQALVSVTLMLWHILVNIMFQ